MNPHELDPELTAGADLMAAIRLSSHAIDGVRSIGSQEEFGDFLTWLDGLHRSEMHLLSIGLLITAWNCLNVEEYEQFLLRMEVDLPPASTKVPADQLRPGDWIRLTQDGKRGVDHQVADISREGGDVTLMFATAASITVPRDTPVMLTRSATID